jgi:hypothetical protein
VAVSLSVSRAFGLSFIESVCAVGSFPAFFLGPFLLIWGLLDWRPIVAHQRKWMVLAVSFAMLFVNPLVAVLTVFWWFANIPGYLVFWIVATNDGHTRSDAQQGVAAKPGYAESP